MSNKSPGIAGATGLQSGQGDRWFLNQKHPQQELRGIRKPGHRTEGRR